MVRLGMAETRMSKQEDRPEETAQRDRCKTQKRNNEKFQNKNLQYLLNRNSRKRKQRMKKLYLRKENRNLKMRGYDS